MIGLGKPTQSQQESWYDHHCRFTRSLCPIRADILQEQRHPYVDGTRLPALCARALELTNRYVTAPARGDRVNA